MKDRNKPSVGAGVGSSVGEGVGLLDVGGGVGSIDHISQKTKRMTIRHNKNSILLHTISWCRRWITCWSWSWIYSVTK